jgi:hypothetical protein
MPDDTVETFLKGQFKKGGKVVSVERLPLIEEANRQFIVVFQYETDAEVFAKEIHRKTFGHYGVTFELPDTTH